MYNTKLYFDEMNLLKEERGQRINTASKFIDDMVVFFTLVLADIIAGKFLTETTREDYEDKLTKIYLDKCPDKTDSAFINRAVNFSDYVQTTTENTIDSIADDFVMFATDVKSGIPVKKEDIPEKVLKVLSDERASKIALNETNWIYNYINHMKLKSDGNATHIWLSMKDEKVRHSHDVADEQIVPINEPFIVNGYKMMFPLDDSFGAPLSEIMGCRCIEI